MPINLELDRRTLLKLGAAAGAALAVPAEAAAAPVSDTGRWLIRNATVVSMDPTLGVMLDTDILIGDGAIAQVGQRLVAPDAQILDASGMIVIPGLVETHWHLWNSALRSSSPAPGGPPFFQAQLANSKRFTPELNALGVRLGLALALEAGITTVNNWAHNLRSPAFADAELAAMQSSGLRARFWYGYAQDLPASAPMDFADLLRVREQLQGAASSRLDLGVAVRGPERTERAIWEAEFAFARDHQLPISTHIAVTPAMQRKRAVQQLARGGWLDASVQLVHATHVDAEDIRSIQQAGASVCLTPLTEMRCGYGLAPVAALQRGGVAITLGIDTLVLSGNANPFMVMQTALNLATGMSGDEQAVTAHDVLHWATQGGADMMGLGHLIGSITPGKRADLAIIDARRSGLLPVLDPLASVVQSATPADVDTVFVEGRPLKRGGNLAMNAL